MSAMKTVLITGSTDGIGLQAAINLAKKGHHIIVHGRSSEKAERTAQSVREKSDNPKVSSLAGDFSSFEQVRKMATEINQKFSDLDILINNAGVYMTERKETRDGHEMTFQVNYLSPCLLTFLVLDTLRKKTETRIVNVASIAHQSAHLDLNDLENKKFDAYLAYANSKIENIYFTYMLAQKLMGTKITANCLHPGVLQTKLLATGWGGGGAPIQKGAEVLEYVGTSPELEDVSGSYFNKLSREKSNPVTYNDEITRKLWEKTLSILGLAK
jgi:retinol dehydrogenase 14